LLGDVSRVMDVLLKTRCENDHQPVTTLSDDLQDLRRSIQQELIELQNSTIEVSGKATALDANTSFIAACDIDERATCDHNVIERPPQTVTMERTGPRRGGSLLQTASDFAGAGVDAAGSLFSSYSKRDSKHVQDLEDGHDKPCGSICSALPRPEDQMTSRQQRSPAVHCAYPNRWSRRKDGAGVSSTKIKPQTLTFAGMVVNMAHPVDGAPSGEDGSRPGMSI